MRRRSRACARMHTAGWGRGWNCPADSTKKRSIPRPSRRTSRRRDRKLRFGEMDQPTTVQGGMCSSLESRELLAIGSCRDTHFFSEAAAYEYFTSVLSWNLSLSISYGLHAFSFPAPQIITQPKHSVRVEPGSRGNTLQVQATGNGLQCQWCKRVSGNYPLLHYNTVTAIQGQSHALCSNTALSWFGHDTIRSKCNSHALNYLALLFPLIIMS